MAQRSEGTPNPFDVTRSVEPDTHREPVRARRLSLPLRMDDGSIRTFELPGALERPSQFSVAELERLTRAYAEALGLIQPNASTFPQ
jgi:hypothetical protein